MGILVMGGQLLLSLSILVILHELGHFLAARAFGIKVDKFYLFFDAWGVSLFKFNYKGVEYGVGWLPLGGYVKIAGMIDESMDREQLAGPPQPWEFRSKPAWQRLIVMLGGIIVNVVVGIFIFWMVVVKYGDSYLPISEAKYGIVVGPVGKKIGLESGDKIVGINGKPIVRFNEIANPKVLLDNVVLNVQRGDKKLDVAVPDNILNDIDKDIENFVSLYPRVKFSVKTPDKDALKEGLKKGDSIIAINGQKIGYYDQLHNKLDSLKSKPIAVTILRGKDTLQLKARTDSLGRIGFIPDVKELKDTTIHYSFFASFPVGADKAWSSFTSNAKGLGKVIMGKVKFQKAISSPVGIAKLYGPSFDWEKFWSLTGLVSLALALMNLLPIPALDGGHVLFLLVEMVKGKPLSEKFLERAQIVGFVVLVCIMVFALGNDIFFSK